MQPFDRKRKSRLTVVDKGGAKTNPLRRPLAQDSPVIHCEASIDISGPPSVVFAFVDDCGKSPHWLGMCQSLELVSPPPKRAGAKMRYAYKEGGKVRTMDGTLSVHEVPRHIELTLHDKMFALVIGHELEASAAGTRFKYTIDITPQSFMAKLMSGMIRSATQKQVEKDVAKLKSLLEAN